MGARGQVGGGQAIERSRVSRREQDAWFFGIGQHVCRVDPSGTGATRPTEQTVQSVVAVDKACLPLSTCSSAKYDDLLQL